MRFSGTFKLTILVLAMALSNSRGFADSISVLGGGTLSFTVSFSGGPCGFQGQSSYSIQSFDNFSYTDPSGSVFPGSGQGAANVNGGGQGCPQSGPQPSVAVSVVQAAGFQIIFFPGNETASISFTGSINPKYVVLAVIYAPPGATSTVTYANQTTLGTTTTTIDTFTSANDFTVSLSTSGSIPGILDGSQKTTVSTTYTQVGTTTNSISINKTTSGSFSLSGQVTDPNTGLNRDYDAIRIWLNPVVSYTLNPKPNGGFQIISQGFGFDLADPKNEIDVITEFVGCLNGHFLVTGHPMKPTCDDLSANVLPRSWARNNTDGTGPGLTAADLSNILKADPFSNSSYAPSVPPGSITSTDGRFTQCANTNCSTTINFEPGITQGYSQGTTVITTNTEQLKFSESFSVSVELSGKFFAIFSATLKVQNTSTFDHSNAQSVMSTNMDTASFNIVGPTPPYSGPTQFVAFQDNTFGSFMFFP